MTDLNPEMRREIFQEIEVAKEIARQAHSSITTHERECAIRYAHLQETQAAHDERLASVQETLSAIALKIGIQDVTAESRTDQLKNWVLGGLIAMLLVALSWTASRVYDLEPARVSAEAGK